MEPRPIPAARIKAAKITANGEWEDVRGDIQKGIREDILSTSSTAASEPSLGLLSYPQRFAALRGQNIKAGIHRYQCDREFKLSAISFAK